MNDEQKYQDFLKQNLYPRKLKSLSFYPDSVPFYINQGGKKLINFSSSDYLGLSQHPELITKSQEYVREFGAGASASRLVTGNFAFYDEIEEKLAKAIHKPAALIMGTGYQTNQSVLEALLDQKILKSPPLIFCDKLCHSSILSIATYFKIHRFAHNDLNHLMFLLNKYSDQSTPKFIIAESIYSMEGDSSDIQQLTEIANQYQAFLYIDDAHAIGVYGEDGWGKTTAHANNIDMIMGTFSKGLGSYGGFVGCSALMKEYLINKCKGLIYSTALPPSVLGSIAAAIDLQPKLAKQRERLLHVAAKVRQFFLDNTIHIGSSDSHIIPWIIGDAEKTRLASQLLEQQGILGSAIQAPSVPVGKSRIRFCISAAHSDEDINQLCAAVLAVNKKLL